MMCVLFVTLVESNTTFPVAKSARWLPSTYRLSNQLPLQVSIVEIPIAVPLTVLPAAGDTMFKQKAGVGVGVAAGVAVAVCVAVGVGLGVRDLDLVIGPDKVPIDAMAGFATAVPKAKRKVDNRISETIRHKITLTENSDIQAPPSRC